MNHLSNSKDSWTTLREKMKAGSTSDTEIEFARKDQLLETANENMIPPVEFNAFVELEPLDQAAAKLRLIMKDGKRYFFPYAYMLRVEFDASGVLTMYTSEQEIIVKGRGLDYIEDRLFESQVRSIIESKVTIDKGIGRVFVASIEINDR